MKKAKAAIAMALACLTLTGCSQNLAQEIVSYQPYDTEDVLISRNLTGTDEELKGLVYQFVTGNITIDPSTLIAPTDTEEVLIREKMNKIISALKGKENASISDELINYMLLEFAKTSKEWAVVDDKLTKDIVEGVTIVGIDPATRKIFVDVAFETTNNDKVEIPQSKIIKGDPLETAMKSARYTQYLEYLNTKYEDNNKTSGSSSSVWSTIPTDDTEVVEENKTDPVAEAREKFEDTWGSISNVLFEQQELTLIQRLRHAILNRDTSIATIKEDDYYLVTGESRNGSTTSIKSGTLTDDALRYIEARGIGTYTYTGITKQNIFSSNNAKMDFRFILDFDFNLGSSTTITTTSVYLLDYYINGYETNLNTLNVKSDMQSSLSVVKPYVDRLINTYHKSVEESNYIGLYSIFGIKYTRDKYTDKILDTASRFADWDKYYVDINRYCYTKFDGYDYEIVGWEDNIIQVLVTRSKKIRGKGTEMTMPTYTEKALMTIEIDGDDIYLENEIVLETTLVGEPVSMIKDVTGIADKIAYTEKSFSSENEAGVLDALQKFSKAQLLLANGDSSALTNCIDYGVGSAQVASIKTIAGNIVSTEKITWLGTWASKSNVYCKVRIREYFKCSANDVDTEAYVGLVNRNGAWTVVTYERTMATVLDIQNISDKGCLTHDYTSKDSTSDYAALSVSEDSQGAVIDSSGAAVSASDDVSQSEDTTPAETAPVNVPADTDPVNVPADTEISAADINMSLSDETVQGITSDGSTSDNVLDVSDVPVASADTNAPVTSVDIAGIDPLDTSSDISMNLGGE